ncbi:MAG: SIMPL domain-containing protein [Pseudomonadota bacterium]
MSPNTLIVIAGFLLVTQAQAQPAGGTLVIVPAFGEVSHANDQAIASFSVEEQDKDKAAAASRVNQKMKQGMEIIRKEDPQAVLKSQGYYTYPVYPEERPLPPGTQAKSRVPTGWRVGQSLEVRTSNLAKLPKTTAAAQTVLGLTNIQFGLTPATIKLLDEQRIVATYANLNERIASIAGAMGRKLADSSIETVDFEGSGRYAGEQAPVQMMSISGARSKGAAEVAEPSFEPGETTLQMRLVGKVKFR